MAVAEHPPNPALDVFLILISEMEASGALDEQAIARIVTKLEFAEYGEIADRVRMLRFNNALFAEFLDGGNKPG